MKNLFTLTFLCLLFFSLMAQKSNEPPKNPFPDDLFKYDQVLPAHQTPDHKPAVENSLLDVMFDENSKVRLRNGELIDTKSNATDGLGDILSQLASFEWQRFSDVSEELLDELSENGTRNTNQPVYNLNNIYRLRISENENIWDLSNKIENLSGIIYARPVPKPAALPTPGNYQDFQGYLDPAVDSPSGIDAEYAWTRYGGTGAGITICDLEYSWNYNHADITKAVGSQINTNVANPFDDNNHGTAVLGEMVSNNNGWGTTGICYNSNIKTCGTYYGSTPSYNPAGAITLSIANLSAGDIILLEQQADYTGSDGFVPIEWYGNYSPDAQTNNPVYAAIVNAVANNIHVVEAGGNGNVNTGNLTWFGNSGAVIVGAGGGYSWNNLEKLNFSSYGSRFDVQGWGENVMTTGYGSYYNADGMNYWYRSDFSGTSSASPIVTGAIALFSSYWVANVSSTRPTPAYMRTLLKQHGRMQVNPGDGIIGSRPDVKAMIRNYVYCAASGGGDEYISRVQCGSIDNSSGSNGYVDYSTLCSTDLASNLTQAITVTNGNPYSSDQCGIWVDWNRDGDFSDASETIAVTGTPGVGPYTATIAVPAGVSIGECTMRVRITYNLLPSPCGSPMYGEVEDYTLNITQSVPNVWTGAFNSYWHNANNWSLGHIPTADENVIMTSAGYHPPAVDIFDEEINDLTIESGAGLIIADQTLVLNGNLTIHGDLEMNTDDSQIDVNGNVSWESGSTANFTNESFVRVFGSYWQFQSGSTANLNDGTIGFFGSNNAYIRSYSANSSINSIYDYKSGGAETGISSWSTQPLTINGDIYVQPSAAFGIYSGYDTYLKGSINSNGIFNCDVATLILDGSSHSIKMNAGNYFNNLTFSQTGTVTINNYLTSIVDVNGDVLIESGVFNLSDRTMNVGGNWTNNAGTAAFTEGASRVIFDGAGHNYVKTSETFNILEANMGAALRVDNAASVVSCNQYDWTTGGIDVVAGTFTALDLADNGIFGGYWLNPGGTINLTNDAWIDLAGDLNIYGGNFNVFGGTSSSYWPYSANASITMSGGVLDFKDRGIYVSGTLALTLTENITGGHIRTAGSFNNQRSDFTPTGNIIELYGSTDENLTTGTGCVVDDVIINKGNNDDTMPTPLFDREGKPIEQTRTSTVLAGSSPLTILGNLYLNAGTFNLSSHTVNVTGFVNINAATLKMTSATDNLIAHDINWNAGSNDNVSAGTFHAYNWKFNEGTNAMLGTGNTAYVEVLYYPTDSDAEFGNLVATSSSKLLSDGTGKTFFPIKVAGNLTMQTGSDWYLAHGLIVMGNANLESGSELTLYSGCDMSCTGSLTLAGSLNFESGSDATVNGDFVFPNTGTLNIGSGTFTNNYISGVASLAGKLMLTTGVVEFPNRSISLSNTFDDNVSGGIIRVGNSFICSSAGTFEPSGGTVEFINASNGNYVQVINGNYLHNMVLDKPGSSFIVYDNLTIKRDLQINDGVLYSNNKTISIAGDWRNNVGASGFNETTGRVIFYGSAVQMCSSEDFYTLEINKPSELLYNISGTSITCQSYDWTSGGLWISPGNFSAADLADNGLYGTFAIFDGTIDLHQDDAQFVDITGDIRIGYNATLNVYGGSGTSFWSYGGDVSITMSYSTGVLDFKDVGIYIYDSPSNTFTENISDGTIRTSGNFNVGDPSFTPAGGTVELYGDLDAGISNFAGSNFHNLLIDKSGGADGGREPFITHGRNGEIIMHSRANEILLISDVLINGNLTVNTGTLNMGIAGYDMTCMGSASIENGASLQIGSASQLKLNTSLTVKNGGTLNSTGALGFESQVTRAATNRYLFEVQPGGNIGSSYTIFEYMGVNGINIASGAVVDPAQVFNNCTFRQGLSANTLLTMNSTQTLECTGAIFPANTWGGTNNIKKTNNAGRITLYDYSGGFAGASYENDLYNRVDWYTPQLSASPLVINVTPPAGTATINVNSNLAWTAFENTSWFSISPLSGSNNGTITVTYNLNTTASARSGSIIISAPDVPDVIVTVNQAGATLAVTPPTRSVSAPAGSTTFSLTSNTGWAVSESVAWFNVMPLSGTGNGTLTVSYGENGTGSPRVGSITVTAPGGLPVATVTLTQSAYPYHDISLTAGWQGLSSYIMPANNDIDDVFAPVLSDLVLAATFDGDIYYPSGPINTIGIWGSQSAYTVKMDDAAMFSIIGMPETDKTYGLATGWNLIPVIANNPVNVATLPTTVGFQIVKDVASTGVYWPVMGINTLGNLLPGKAYYVRVTSAGNITFPANTDVGWDGKYPETTLLRTPWDQPVASPVSHLIALTPGATEGFMAGDIVGIFTSDDICCGLALIETPGGPLAITAFADDEQQLGSSGYVSGQAISLKVYRPALDEITPLVAVYEPSGNEGVFADQGLSVITDIQQSATGIAAGPLSEVDIYPNPTNGIITVAGISQYSLLQIYSVRGEMLLQHANDAARKLQWDLSSLPPGVYQLKLSGNHQAVVKKLIRN